MRWEGVALTCLSSEGMCETKSSERRMTVSALMSGRTSARRSGGNGSSASLSHLSNGFERAATLPAFDAESVALRCDGWGSYVCQPKVTGRDIVGGRVQRGLWSRLVPLVLRSSPAYGPPLPLRDAEAHAYYQTAGRWGHCELPQAP